MISMKLVKQSRNLQWPGFYIIYNIYMLQRSLRRFFQNFLFHIFNRFVCPIKSSKVLLHYKHCQTAQKQIQFVTKTRIFWADMYILCLCLSASQTMFATSSPCLKLHFPICSAPGALGLLCLKLGSKLVLAVLCCSR